MSLISANLPPAAPPSVSVNDNRTAELKANTQPADAALGPFEAAPLAVPLAPEGRFPNQGDLFSMLFDLDGNNAISLDDFAQTSGSESGDLVKLYEASQLRAETPEAIERKA